MIDYSHTRNKNLLRLTLFLIILAVHGHLSAKVDNKNTLTVVFYVDSTNGRDSDDGLSVKTAWKTIGKLNSYNFFPGSIILFKRGEVWREQLSPPSSGSVDAPITFGTYGNGANPVINGADVLTGWNRPSSKIDNVYYNLVPWIPKQIFRNGVRLVEQSGKGNLAENYHWYYDSENKILYVYSTTDPNTDGSIWEASQRTNCILIRDKSYLKINSIDLRCSNSNQDGGAGLKIETIYNNIKDIDIVSMNISYHYYNAILLKTNIGHNISNINITNTNGSYNSLASYIYVACTPTVHFYGHGGFVENINMTSSHLSYCGVHDASGFMVQNAAVGVCLTHTSNVAITNCEVDHVGSSCINIEDASKYVTISGGSVHDVLGTAGDRNCIGIGGIGDANRNSAHISINSVDIYNSANANIEISPTNKNNSHMDYISVRNCKIHGASANSGIKVSNGNHVGLEFYYNIIYSNHDHGIEISGSKGTLAEVAVYNNLIWNNGAVGLYNLFGNVSFKNNILSQNSSRNNGWRQEVVKTPQAILTSDYNCIFHTGTSDFMNWNWKDCTFDQWREVSGKDQNSINVDPRITDPPNDFRLREGSPCIDAGEYAGLTRDYWGNPVPMGSAPDIGITEYMP
jgi:hypothetical protein